MLFVSAHAVGIKAGALTLQNPNVHTPYTRPLMSPDTGRAVDYVVLRDGREVSPYTVMTPVEALTGVAQFEILQEAIDRVLVRIVPSPSWEEMTRDLIHKSMNEILPGVRIEVDLVELIDQQSTVKYRIVQSRVARPSI